MISFKKWDVQTGEIVMRYGIPRPHQVHVDFGEEISVKDRGIIYLACPYSHEDYRVRHDRFRLVTRKAAQLMKEGFVVFSPVTHSHLISDTGLVDGLDYDFWVKQDLVFMQICDEVHVLTLDGWMKSRGVKAEIQEAFRLGIPVIMETA